MKILLPLLRVIWRGAEAVLQLLWELVRAVSLPAAHGIGDLLRKVAPWAAGIGGLYLLWVYNPQVVETLVAAAIYLGTLLWVLRKWAAATLGGSSKKKSRR